jgi:hypothetical protein
MQYLSRFDALWFVRDLFHIPGQIQLDAQGHVLQITLPSAHPHASAFAYTLAQDHLSLILDEI